jgi:hypothetical protein
MPRGETTIVADLFFLPYTSVVRCSHLDLRPRLDIGQRSSAATPRERHIRCHDGQAASKDRITFIFIGFNRVTARISRAGTQKNYLKHELGLSDRLNRRGQEDSVVSCSRYAPATKWEPRKLLAHSWEKTLPGAPAQKGTSFASGEHNCPRVAGQCGSLSSQVCARTFLCSSSLSFRAYPGIILMAFQRPGLTPTHVQAFMIDRIRSQWCQQTGKDKHEYPQHAAQDTLEALDRASLKPVSNLAFATSVRLTLSPRPAGGHPHPPQTVEDSSARELGLHANPNAKWLRGSSVEAVGSVAQRCDSRSRAAGRAWKPR